MREIIKIGESEFRLCLILWEHEPIPSGELVGFVAFKIIREGPFQEGGAVQSRTLGERAVFDL